MAMLHDSTLRNKSDSLIVWLSSPHLQKAPLLKVLFPECGQITPLSDKAKSVIESQGKVEAFEFLELTVKIPVYVLPKLHEFWSRTIAHVDVHSCTRTQIRKSNIKFDDSADN